MNELATVLDELVADAPLERSSWSDVEARLRRLRAGQRRSPRGFAKKRLLLAIAALVSLALVTGAVGVGLSLLAQQESYHAGATDHPGQVSPMVEITSGEGWAMIAWKSDVGVCIDFAVPGNAGFGCDFPVRGAKPASHTSGSGPPVHAAAGFVVGGGMVGGDGKATIFGIAASEVAAVNVELRDDRVVEAQVFDAPAPLGADVRFFIVRLWLPPQRLSDPGRVRAFLAYDKRGDLIERFEF